MPDIDEKLIVTLGQRLSEQNEILRMIAASLQGAESHLRQIAILLNPAPNYQRPLTEYPILIGPPSAQPFSIGMTTARQPSNGTARSSHADRQIISLRRRSGFRAVSGRMQMEITGMRG